MTGRKSLEMQESGHAGDSPKALPKTQTEQPWAELAAWLRWMHTMAKSELRPAEPKSVGEYFSH